MQDTDRQTEKKGSLLVFIRRLLPFIVVVVLVGYFISGSFLTPATVELSNKEVVEGVGNFVEITFDQPEKSLTSIKCDPKEGCVSGELEDKYTPASGWLVAYYSRLYKKTGDERFKKKINYHFNRIGQSLSDTESYHLWPLYEAYQATGEEQYLWYFVINIAQFAHTSASIDVENLYQDEFPMVLTNFSTQLLMLRSLLLSNKWPQANYGKSHPNFFRWIQDFISKAQDWDQKILNTSQQFLTAAEKYEAKFSKVSPEDAPQFLFVSDQRFSNQACWLAAGHWRRYELTGDERSLDNVIHFLTTSNLQNKNLSDFETEIVQNILPCIEVLKGVASKRPEYTATLHRFLEELVGRALDSRVRTLCDGDNSLLMMVKSETASSSEPVNCRGQYASKEISDNAYFYLIGEGLDMKYTIPKLH